MDVTAHGAVVSVAVQNRCEKHSHTHTVQERDSVSEGERTHEIRESCIGIALRFSKRPVYILLYENFKVNKIRATTTTTTGIPFDVDTNILSDHMFGEFVVVLYLFILLRVSFIREETRMYFSIRYVRAASKKGK